MADRRGLVNKDGTGCRNKEGTGCRRGTHTHTHTHTHGYDTHIQLGQRGSGNNHDGPRKNVSTHTQVDRQSEIQREGEREEELQPSVKTLWKG